eukprot:s6029_g1.t1
MTRNPPLSLDLELLLQFCFVKAAEQDLEKMQTGKEKGKDAGSKPGETATSSEKPRKRIKPTTAKPKSEGEAVRRLPPPKPNMIEDVKHEEESGKEEDDDDDDAKSLRKPAALELEDGDPDSEVLKELESGSDDDSDQDDDVFAKEFALPVPAAPANRFDGLPEKLRKLAGGICKQILESIPVEMSRTLVLYYRARVTVSVLVEHCVREARPEGRQADG